MPTNDFVREGYNKIAVDYSIKRDQFKNLKYLEKLNTLLKPNSTILDVGCGAGIPIDKYFIEKGHKVIGIDISDKQIELAKKNVPKAKFEIKDISDLKENEYRVEAVVSFYTIFHLKRETHAGIFKKINSFLPKGGLILVTMGSTDWEGTEDDFHGVKMFWSHYDNKRNSEIIKNAGFEILLNEIDTSGGEKHQIIMAKKSNKRL